MTLILQGDDRLLATLQRLKTRDAKAAARKGCRAGGKKVLAAQKREAGAVPGKLQPHIKVRALKPKKDRVGVRVSSSTSKPGLPIEMWIEWGTKRHKAKRRHISRFAKGNEGYFGLSWHIFPRRFLRRGFDSVSGAAMIEARRVTAEEIERRAAR